MLLKEIINYLHEWAPKSYQESYDNSQLITGSPNQSITKAIVCLDAIESVVDEAIEKKANLIIAHHPIVFNGLKSLTGKNYVERTIIKAIKNDIAIFALHTNLDNVATGVNAKIAEKIGLTNTKILAPKANELYKLVVFTPENNAPHVQQAMFDAGAGHIGDYSETSFNTTGTGTFKPGEHTNPSIGSAAGPRESVTEIKTEVILPKHQLPNVLSAMQKAHPYETVAYDVFPIINKHHDVGSGMIGKLDKAMKTEIFLQHLAQTFGCSVIRHTKLVKNEINTVAVCGGAGSFLLANAMQQGADIFITGDFKYHEFFDADNQIIIADIGHYESEQFTSDLIVEKLSEKFPNFAFLLTETLTNPVQYYTLQ